MSKSSFLFNSNIFLSFPPIPQISSPSISSLNPRKPISHFPFPAPNQNPKTTVRIRFRAPTTFIRCRKPDTDTQSDVGCIGTGSDVECVAAVASSDAGTSESDRLLPPLRPSSKSASFEIEENGGKSDLGFAYGVWDSALLVSPFFFWGTAMVAMKEVLPKAGPFFVSSFRLIPAGVMLIAFAAARGRKQPSGTAAWVWILLFGVVDAACFQVGFA